MRKLPLLFLTAAIAGCSAPPDAPTESAPAQAAVSEHTAVSLTAQQQAGRAIYETMCWTCHGTAGRGDGPAVQAGSLQPPPTFHTQDYALAETDRLERRFRVALEGADPNHPHMQYVSSLLQPERFGEALSFIPALAYPPELPGSALAGQRIYEFRCQGCHGTTGRGDGPAAASLSTVAPADFRTDELLTSQDWDAIFARISEGGQTVHGSSMPPWGIVLPEAEIWDLVAFLATFQDGLLSDPAWMN